MSSLPEVLLPIPAPASLVKGDRLRTQGQVGASERVNARKKMTALNTRKQNDSKTVSSGKSTSRNRQNNDIASTLSPGSGTFRMNQTRGVMNSMDARAGKL